MTTASIGSSHPTPIGTVVQPSVASDDGHYSPNNPQARQPLATYQPAPAYKSAPYNSSSVSRTTLPKPITTNHQADIDPIRTSSVATPAPAPGVGNEQPAPNGVGGWTGVGGTSVTLRSGETLYNLSKRYGVPVKEIMRVNNISDPNSVQANQSILIPTYVYSRNAPVSAPDNNPGTKAASAARGNLGQVNSTSVAVPSTRPQQIAALNSQNVQESNPVLEPRSKVKPWTEDTEKNLPDYSIVTGSVAKAGDLVNGQYKVVAGDSLSKIASRYNVSTSALMQANGLSGSNIGIGQTLMIPGIAAAAAPIASTAQKVVATTNSVTSNLPKPYVKPTLDKTVTSSVDTKAPEATGIGKLRWPVSGRVVSGFGDTRNGSRNDGIDISVPEGTAVKAAENGVVIYSGSDLENFGNLVLIRHSDGIVTAYAHNKYNNVKKGADVRRGQVIAASGRTGSTTTPMLHFEVRKNSKPVDPKIYLGS
ncbi:MAG: peptidoglycan DD-metalloendopeptidase family protein [Salaquimonas sp.]